MFQERGEPFEQRSNLGLIKDASGDEQLARAGRRQRRVGFEQALDFVAILPATQSAVERPVEAVWSRTVQRCVCSFAHCEGDGLRRKNRRLTGCSGGLARNQIVRSGGGLLRSIRICGDRSGRRFVELRSHADSDPATALRNRSESV